MGHNNKIQTARRERDEARLLLNDLCDALAEAGTVAQHTGARTWLRELIAQRDEARAEVGRLNESVDENWTTHQQLIEHRQRAEKAEAERDAYAAVCESMLSELPGGVITTEMVKAAEHGAAIVRRAEKAEAENKKFRELLVEIREIGPASAQTEWQVFDLIREVLGNKPTPNQTEGPAGAPVRNGGEQGAGAEWSSAVPCPRPECAEECCCP